MSAKAILSASVSAPPAVYVEDVFSTFLYTGNGSTQTITNGIDLSGKGGLVWIKSRNLGTSHVLTDTTRGSSSQLYTDRTFAQGTVSDQVTAFTGSGFSLGTDSLGTGTVNANPYSYCSWTFRKAAKFFDVVTYTGNGVSGRTVSHNLGSVPGCIIVKRLTGANANWPVYHRSLNGGVTPENYYIYLSVTDGENSSPSSWNNTAPTSTNFTVGNAGNVNASGDSFVAYVFAHDAGGFGTAGTDNVVSCGTFTTAGSGNATVTLGYEPQWLLIKSVGSSSWYMVDIMRGLVTGGNDSRLQADQSDAEYNLQDLGAATSTGFNADGSFFATSQQYIYIAIRRGPMKTPTVGTAVFSAIARTGAGSGSFVSSSGFSSDLFYIKRTDGSGSSSPGFKFDRLRGGTSGGYGISPATTNAENSIYSISGWDAANNNGVRVGNNNNYWDTSGAPYVNYHFRRAPGFFDVVAYTGTGAGSFNHNLGVVPELIIVKQRATAGNSWGVYSAATGNTHWLALQATQAAVSDSTMWNNTTPTNTVFSIGSTSRFSGTCIAYLFATAPGVSKVGNYTGTGTTKQIDCGFTAGARFVLIKRTDSTGDWYVWDTARGIISGNDPYLLLNSNAAEVTGTDYIDPLSSGFEISSTAPAAINANGGSFIFFAVA